MAIQILVGGAPGLAQHLERTNAFSIVHSVNSTSELRTLISRGVLKVAKNQIAFAFSDTMLVDTPDTPLDLLLGKLSSAGFSVVILSTMPAGGQLLNSAPNAVFVEAPFNVNLVLKAITSTGITSLSPVTDGSDTIDIISGLRPAPTVSVVIPSTIRPPITSTFVAPLSAPTFVAPTFVAPTFVAPQGWAASTNTLPTTLPKQFVGLPPSGRPLAMQPPVQLGEPQKINSQINGVWPTATANPAPYSATHANGKRPTIILAVGAAKGGVGKTTLSISLAVRAGLKLRASGESVALLDCNYGQSDIGRYMQIFDGPTIVDIARDRSLLSQENIRKAMIHRPELNLHILRGPATAAEGNPQWINARLYSQITDVLRGMFSVIVMDLPVAEKFLDMYASFALPESDFIVVPVNPNVTTLLAVDSWLHTISEPIVAGGNGIDPAKLGIVLNRTKPGVDCDEADVRLMLARWNFITAIPESEEWQRANNNGEILAAGTSPDLITALDAILFAATAMGEFVPQQQQEAPRKRSLFSKLRKK